MALDLPVGIDLGTTNSLLAVFRDGQPELIANASGSMLTPSAVATQDGQLLVGQAAWDYGLTHPQEVALAFKRQMGTDKSLRLGKLSMSAPELSAIVLKKLKADAEETLGQTVSEAVVTVPAYFNQSQREATMAACRLAGIKPLSLINEPTAAALAYGLQDRDGESQFLVFDLGGGTFDVTILEHFDGVMEVRASSGDAHLGGEDFTNVVLKLLREALGFGDKTLSEDTQARLRYFAELAKRKLSSDAPFTFEFDLDGEERSVTLSPEDFEHAAQPLLRRLRAPMHRCLFDNDGLERDIDRVILVGGATRMPLARRFAAKETRLFPDASINPDHVVALGAAIQAALIKEDRALGDVVMTDVSPFSVGIEASHGKGRGSLPSVFAPIIERNTPLPASRVHTFSAVVEDQKEMRISVYQGESARVENNVFLGEFRVNLPQGPDRPKYPTVDLRITQDHSGLIEVLAKVGHADVEESLTVATNALDMSEAEIRKRMKRLDHLKVHPREDQANKAVLNRLERLFEMATGEDRQFLQDKLVGFESVLATQDPKAIENARKDMNALLDSIDAFHVS